MVIVTESDVIAPVLLKRRASSLNQGPLAMITGVIVTPPVPPPPTPTVRSIVVVRLNPPPVPVTVIAACPRAAVLDAVRVNVVPAPVDDSGAKAAVTPAGKPLAVKATLPVNPPVRVIATALVPIAPRLTVKLDGVAESAKSGVDGSLTVRLIVDVRVRPPPVPVIVTVAGPSVAAVDAVNVTVLLIPVTDAGVNPAVTPAGSPLALNVTLPVNPPVRVMVIVLLALAPRFTVTADGLAECEKSGSGGIDSAG
jgi:hypothetical protein